VAGPALAVETIPPSDLKALQDSLRRGRCEEALIGVEALKKRFPDAPDLFVIESNCALLEARREETRFLPEAYWALRLRAGGRMLTPKERESLYETVVIYEPEGLARATSLLEEAIRRAPFRRDLYLGRCFLTQETGQHEALLEAVALTATRFPDDETARSLLSYADAYLSRGESAAALEVVEVVVEHFPQSSLASALLGRCRLYGGDLEGARSAYAMARSQDVESVEVAREGAQVEMLARAWLEANELLKVAAAKAPRNADVLFQILFAQARLNPPAAFPYIERYFRLIEGQAGLHSRAAARLARLLAGEEEPTVEAWYELGERLAAENLFGPALAAWEFALDLDPSRPEVLGAMGDLYSGLRLVNEAQEAYARALEAAGAGDPSASASELHQSLASRSARAYALAGQYAEARAAYEALDEPSAHALDLAALCQALEDIEGARRWLTVAAENAGNEALAAEARRRLGLLEPADGGP
jgi:tetratricopeptide (TPR) repeat protein